MYVTVPSDADATRMAELLLSKELVACVNIIPQIKSIYKWEGKVESSQEVMMMIKVSRKHTKYSQFFSVFERHLSTFSVCIN
jgi:periplasmic divalent cation tolerance protein